MKRRTIIITVLFVLILTGLLVCPAFCRKTEHKGLNFVNKTSDGQENLVVVTHGWIEKGKNDWPEDMAEAILKRVDSNDWLCGYFDWSKGASTINPLDAATYARDISGAALAGQVLQLNRNLKHIHLIGHSCGAWTISESAKILVRQTNAHIHLTFLDAYVPKNFNADSLGDINTPSDVNYWADQYYTRDYTLEFTEHNLKHAHNVDVTEIDQIIKDHNFPWKWYYATIAGKFPKWSFLNDDKLVTDANGTEYGFARSKEASKDNWQKSLELKMGNKAVTIKK
ncbi:MAG: hypothetical protein JW804_05515 [Sedimentisphaerales bacterium]|nr:hypothetical protein [Sedimentisphaerales bacterium]